MKPLVLLLPLAVSAALAMRLRAAGKDRRNAIAQGAALGFSLPLAIALLFALPWPDAEDGFFQEMLTRFSIALVVIPQVYILFEAGLVFWKRFARSNWTDAGTGVATALLVVAIALLGQLWTWAILSAGPVVA